jgi:hypothetical protein
MSSGHLAVLVTTDTPDTVDLLDVMNFLQFSYFGGKTSATGETLNVASPQPQSKDAKSRAGRAESTVGIPQPVPQAPAEAPQVVVFEKCGLGGEGQPVLEGQELATALLSAMEKAAVQLSNSSPSDGALNAFSPTAFSPTALSPTALSPPPATTSPPPCGAPAAFSAPLPPTVGGNLQRVIVVGCPSLLVANAIVTSGLYAVSLVLTVNSVDPFPQLAKLQEALGGKGAPKKPEAKKVDPKKKGDTTGKPSGPANVAARLQADFAAEVAVAEFVTFDIGNAALAEGAILDASNGIKNVEARLSEYTAWVQGRRFSVVPPVPATFSLTEWTRLRTAQDLAHVDIAATICTSATRLLGSRSDGWSLVSEVQQSLVGQLGARSDPVRQRIVQLIDNDAYLSQQQQRQALIAKIQQLRAEQEQQLDGGPAPAAAAGGPSVAKKAPEKPAKGGKESQSQGASPLPVDGSNSPIPDIPPPEPLPTVGYPFVVEERPVQTEAASEQDARWIVRQFVKRSLGRLDAESDAAKQLTEMIAAGNKAQPLSPSAAVRSSDALPLLEASVRDLYRAATAPPSLPGDIPSGFEDFPTRSKALFRATRSMPELTLKETEPTIRDALIKRIEQAHTVREKNFALLQTIADQALRESFRESAVPLRAHQYVEAIDKETTNERLLQYVEHHGSDVTRVVRVDLTDDQAKTKLQASQQVAQPSQAVIIAAVDVPASRQKTIINEFHVSGLPSFTQAKLWAMAQDSDVRKKLLNKPSFCGKSQTAPTCFVSDTTKLVFPYDGSVVRVHDSVLSSSRSVTYSKADLKASLHSSIIKPENPLTHAPGARRRFTTTFNDGVVFTASQPDALPKPPSQGGQSSVALGGTLGATTAGTTSFQGTPRGGPAAAGEGASVLTTNLQASNVQRTVTPMSGTVPPPGVLPAASICASNQSDGPTKKASEVPFSFDPCIPSNTTITITKNNFALTADETRGDVSFQFSKRDARKSLLYGLSGAALTVIPSIEFEVSRTIDNFSGAVHRFFASGAQQALFADGSVATRLSTTAPWLMTAVDGTRCSQHGATIPDDAAESRSKCAVDRERSCRVRSRVDGVVIAEYFSPPSSEGHTRVTAHADGTVIVTIMGAQSVSSTVLDNLYSEVASLSSFGQCTFVVESPVAPRVFLFAPVGPLNAFFVQLGDNSVLERHIMPPQTSEQCSYMQTVFCRGSESTLRYNHDSALMFVEPHDVHLATTNPNASNKPTLSSSSVVSQRMQTASKLGSTAANLSSHQSMNNIAICEAIAVFDLALGGMRLVDREKYVTQVSGIFDFSEPDVAVSFEHQDVMELLLLMLPTGFQTHTRPKKLLQKLEEERAAREEEDDSDVGSFPGLVDRLRLLAQTFVIENRLIQQESLRRPHNSSLLPHKTTAAETPQDDQDALTRLLANNARPLVFAEIGPDHFEHLMCAADLAAFLRVTSNKQWTVASSTCSGEPGIEQIAFYRASGSALLVPFEGSALEGGGTPWLPKSLQPPRRFVTPGPLGTNRVGSPAVPHTPLPSGFAPPGTAPDFPLHGALRVLLRYAPLSHNARAAIVASHIESQVRYGKMNRYAKSLQDAIGVEDEATAAGLEMLWSRHGDLLSSVSPSNIEAQPQLEPSPARPSEGGGIPATVSPSDDLMVPAKGTQQRPAAPVVLEHAVTFSPAVVDFGPLAPGFSYHVPVTARNHTSHTLLFEIFDPLPFNHFGALLPSFVSVTTHRFMLSPFGESLINIMVTLSPEAISCIASKSADAATFDEVLRLECHALKANFKLHVVGSANFASNAKQALRTSVHIVDAAR